MGCARDTLVPGIRNTLRLRVTDADTALFMGSGELPVLATPALARLMEECAQKSVAPYLPEGATTVGTKLELLHTSADPVGVEVECESELTEADSRRLSFRITARDGAGEVATCLHERFIVDKKRFTEKAERKRG